MAFPDVRYIFASCLSRPKCLGDMGETDDKLFFYVCNAAILYLCMENTIYDNYLKDRT